MDRIHKLSDFEFNYRIPKAFTLISGLEIREYGRRDPSRWLRGTLYPQKLALISSISGGLSVGIVRSGTQATVCVFTLIWSRFYTNIAAHVFSISHNTNTVVFVRYH
jgi:hypothetical protein